MTPAYEWLQIAVTTAVIVFIIACLAPIVAKAAPTNCSTVCHNIGGGYQQCTTTCS